MDIETPSGLQTITVEEGNTILQTALDQGIELTHGLQDGGLHDMPGQKWCAPYLDVYHPIAQTLHGCT